MDFIVTKNSLVDLNVFFYKKGMINIHRPMISMLKIDSSNHSEPFFHIGFKHNMGYSSSNHIISGVMIFEVLEGYPLQSILFINNDSPNKPYKQSLEELDSMDLYCVQKRNEDPYGDFVLKNVKFINTQYNQSTSDFSRRLVATFVAESKENFRIPFFFNHFKSDVYSSHIIRDKKEIDEIKKDLNNTWDRLPKDIKSDCIYALGLDLRDLELETIKEALDNVWKKIYLNKILGNTKVDKTTPLYRMREFIRVYYDYANQLNYYLAKARGDLDFLNFINLENRTDITNSYKEDLLFKNNEMNERLKYIKKANKPNKQKIVVNKKTKNDKTNKVKTLNEKLNS